MTLAFESINRGTVTYSAYGATVTKAVEVQGFGTRPTCSLTSEARDTATNYQDLWWNSLESGWGLNLTHQGATLFATLFTYAGDSRDMWLVASGLTRQGDGSFSGTLYRTVGQPFNAAWAAPTVNAVGNMSLAFSSGTRGTLTYSVNGVTVTKAIGRQLFDARPTMCR
jgi:hypothetical protein